MVPAADHGNEDELPGRVELAEDRGQGITLLIVRGTGWNYTEVSQDDDHGNREYQGEGAA
jgi:hypothetical protein